MASRTSAEMSWVDLNIPDTLEGEPDLMAFLPLWPAWVCESCGNSWPLLFSHPLLLSL